MTSLLDAARGRDATLSMRHAVGRRAAIDSAGDRDIWAGGEIGVSPQDQRTVSDAASVLTIVSTSANDDEGGTGARSVLVEGLDDSFAEISEIVVMNGVTPVATTKAFRRTLDMRAATVGSGGTNAGEITAIDGGPKLHAAMLAGVGRASMAMFTVPADRAGYLTRLWCAASAAVDVCLLSRGVGGPVIKRVETRSAALEQDLRGPWRFDAKTDIWMRAKTTTSTAFVAGGFDLLLETY